MRRFKQVFTAVLCLCLVFLLLGCSAGTPPVSEPPAAESAPVPTPEPTPDPTPTPTPYDPFGDPAVLWSDELDYLGMSTPRLPSGISVSYLLNAALEAAGDNDLLALTVVSLPKSVRNGEEYEALYAAYDRAQEHLSDTGLRVTAELQDALGISEQEADARKYSHPDVIRARADLRTATEALRAYVLTRNLEQNRALLDTLAEKGFIPVYDASDPAYHNYLASLDAQRAIATVIGTKAQLLALDPEELNSPYLTFAHALRDADTLEYRDSYTYFEIHLAADSKLTDELMAAYEENGGEALPVSVKIAYWGRVYGWQEAENKVLWDMGFGNITDLYAYGTPEDEEEFHEKFDRLYYHLDYNEDVVTRLLREGELTRWDQWEEYRACSFLAELTYERALELAQDKEIAYIGLPDPAQIP